MPSTTRRPGGRCSCSIVAPARRPPSSTTAQAKFVAWGMLKWFASCGPRGADVPTGRSTTSARRRLRTGRNTGRLVAHREHPKRSGAIRSRDAARYGAAGWRRRYESHPRGGRADSGWEPEHVPAQLHDLVAGGGLRSRAIYGHGAGPRPAVLVGPIVRTKAAFFCSRPDSVFRHLATAVRRTHGGGSRTFQASAALGTSTAEMVRGDVRETAAVAAAAPHSFAALGSRAFERDETSEPLAG